MSQATAEQEFQAVLDALDQHQCHVKHKPGSDKAEALCPVHDKRNPSLSIALKGDKVVLYCHAGCDYKDVVAAVGLTVSVLFAQGNGRRARSARSGGGGRGHSSSTGATGATAQQSGEEGKEEEEAHSAGCTLAQYAELKGLPITFLKSQGLSEISYQGALAVRIPYFGRDGRELLSVQFRTGMHKPADGPDLRFRFKSGNRAVPYGQWKIAEARKAGHITLVEGASDCHTLWFHGEPALGFPGANAWNDERDAALLDGFSTVYVVVEPDTGGETVKNWLATSRIRDRVRLVRLPPERKDPSALHIACKADRAAFLKAWGQALAAAVAWADVQAEASQASASAAWAACADLAQQDHILDLFYEALTARGVAGEKHPSQLLYLAMASRVFDRPVSVIVKAPSSTGKSFVAERVAEFFPADAYLLLTAMSERALAYSDEPLEHRMVVLAEASALHGDMGSYLVRSLLSEGRLIYWTNEKTAEGIVPRKIEKAGPTGLIVGTTAVSLHSENETRHISVSVTDTPEQTSRVLLALAEGLDREVCADGLARWHALQTWLASTPARVSVPYAKVLARLIPPVAVRLRRDFKSILILIQAHALLHQKRRQRDGRGRIVATLDDYAVVRELVADLVAQGVEASVPPIVRETVIAVAELVRERNLGDKGVSVTELAKHLKLDKSVVSRRAKVAIERDYLRNLEERQRQPARLVVGVDMPADVEILPSIERVRESWTVEPVAPVARDAVGEDIQPPPPMFSGHARQCMKHAGELMPLKADGSGYELCPLCVAEQEGAA